MKIICDISIFYKDHDEARTILKSVEVDNMNFVDSHLVGKSIETRIENISISSILHTIDDYLSCISVAEKVIDKKK